MKEKVKLGKLYKKEQELSGSEMLTVPGGELVLCKCPMISDRKFDSENANPEPPKDLQSCDCGRDWNSFFQYYGDNFS